MQQIVVNNTCIVRMDYFLVSCLFFSCLGLHLFGLYSCLGLYSCFRLFLGGFSFVCFMSQGFSFVLPMMPVLGQLIVSKLGKVVMLCYS